MKLLTQSGLLYSAVQAQTVDGHYGAFPEIDWSVQFDEAVSTTIGGAASDDTTIGINPSIRQIETGYDGGKVITGNGYYTGTVTFAWVVKMFGTDACGAAAVNVPSGYVIWTSFKQAAATSANCIAGASWIWTPFYTTATDSIKRSSLATDTSEDWKNGYDNTAAFGSVVFYTVVGGVNAMATYGMGRWNISMWAIQKTGT